MPTTSPLQGFPLPEPDDADNVPYDLAALAGAIEGRTNMRFASESERDSIITTPIDGMRAYIEANESFCRYQGGAWRYEAAIEPTDPLVSPPFVIMYASAQSFSANVLATVNFTVEGEDPFGLHSGTNTYVTIATPGLYLATVNLGFDGGSVSAAVIQLRRNGSAYRQQWYQRTGNTGSGGNLVIPVRFTAGQTCDVLAQVSSAVTLNTAGTVSSLSLHWLAP